MKKKQLTKITESIYTKYDIDNNVIEMKTKKLVKKIGDGSHIILPKSMIGKEVLQSLRSSLNSAILQIIQLEGKIKKHEISKNTNNTRTY